MLKIYLVKFCYLKVVVWIFLLCLFTNNKPSIPKLPSEGDFLLWKNIRLNPFQSGYMKKKVAHKPCRKEMIISKLKQTKEYFTIFFLEFKLLFNFIRKFH